MKNPIKILFTILTFFLLSAAPISAQLEACLPGFCKSVTPGCNGGNVVLLMPFTGTNGSSGSPGFDDISPAVHGTANTASGTPVISTAQFQFAPSSLLTTLGDNFISWPFSTDWALSSTNTDQFTIEYRVNYNALTSGTTSVALAHAADGTFGFEIEVIGTEIRYRWSPTGLFADIQNLTTAGAGLVTGSFFAIAVTKDSSGTLRIFVNGVIKLTATPADSTFHASSPDVLSIGGRVAGSSSPNAYHDELRINKGKACYTANYVPSTVPFSP